MILPRTQLANGESISIQGSEWNYCRPRTNAGPYTEVELGFPSFVPSSDIMRYAEKENDPMGTVYAWVPIELVERMIKDNGGLSLELENAAICTRIGLDFSELVAEQKD